MQSRPSIIYSLIVITQFVLMAFGLPKSIEKRVQKELQKTFEVQQLDLNNVQIPENLNEILPQKINATNFFTIKDQNKKLGYVFVDKAMSKTAKFDYMVILNTDLVVINTKVLVYREEYGGEIGSKRWLKQFMGKTGNDRVNHETNIDGIAGATISVRSMTNAVDRLLQTIGILQEKKIL